MNEYTEIGSKEPIVNYSYIFCILCNRRPANLLLLRFFLQRDKLCLKKREKIVSFYLINYNAVIICCLLLRLFDFDINFLKYWALEINFQTNNCKWFQKKTC